MDELEKPGPPPRRVIRAGVERLPAGLQLPRHQHRDAYVTVVFGGAYQQTAYAGRLRIGEGDVVLQPTFDCHADRMLSAGVDLLRLPWPCEFGLGGVFEGCDIDTIRSLAKQDLAEATTFVASEFAARTPRRRDLSHWACRLADDLVSQPHLRVNEWSRQIGLSRESVARGFRAAYGVGPARFRSEVRAREAWRRISNGADAFTTIAHDLGFSDQAHMTRAVKWLTGMTPSEWRMRATTLPKAA